MKLVKLCDITVFGVPQSAGSKQAFVPLHPKTKQPYRDKKGRIVVSVVDDNPKLKKWQAQVKSVARKVMGAIPPYSGPVYVKVSFYVTRPKNHFRTGKFSHLLRANAPGHVTVRPDATKFWRGVEDALTKVVWVDDAQVVNQQISKSYGSQAGVRVEVFKTE